MKRFLFLLSYLTAISLITAFILYGIITPKPVGEKVVEIKYGTPVPEIAEILEREGVINSRYLFLILHAFLRGKLEAGEYEFKGNLSLYEVYKILEEGRARLYKIVVKEGDDLFDIAKNLEKNKICKAKDFLRYAFSEEVVKRYNLDVPSMEGFLFPDTYYFSKNTHPLKVIDVMYKNFLEKTENLRKHLEEKNLSLEVWVTIASMVEKETFLKEEKPLIAAVIYNRLRRGMKLQIDPTVIYVAKRRGLWRGRLLKRFFYIDDPYNTYLYFGLPPGPISNPGLDSLKASLFPAKVDYLYFVADRYGRKHYFARTYVEHLRNMRRARR
ncbi:endolytic transglycosylase MltG [Aquifex pyrophilus]